jgi:hypothetical protein
MFCDMRISTNMPFVQHNMAAWLQLKDRLLAMKHKLCVTFSGHEQGFLNWAHSISDIFMLRRTHITSDIFMLYRTHIISDVCYIGHTYQTYFLYRTHALDIYITPTHYIRHIYVISDILMLYRTYLCLSDTHKTYLCCIGHIIPDIFVISDIFILWRTYFFYRTCLCYIGRICIVWDT